MWDVIDPFDSNDVERVTKRFKLKKKKNVHTS